MIYRLFKTNSISSLIPVLFAAVCILSSAKVTHAEVMTSPRYSVESDSLNFAGGDSSSASYSMNSAVGEVGSGYASSSTRQIHAGFEQSEPRSPVATTSTSSIPTSSGYISSGSRIVFSTTTIAAVIDEMIQVASSSNVEEKEIPIPVEWIPSDRNVLDSITMKSVLDPKIQALNFNDFEFVQDEGQLKIGDKGLVYIDGTQNLKVRLQYSKAPEILKTIAVTMIDPLDDSKVFTFVLRANKDKSYYEATIGPLGHTGIYRTNIVVLDMENQGMKKLSGNLVASVGGADLSVLENVWSPGKTAAIAMFILAVIVLIILALKKRDSCLPKFFMILLSISSLCYCRAWLLSFFRMFCRLSTAKLVNLMVHYAVLLFAANFFV